MLRFATCVLSTGVIKGLISTLRGSSFICLSFWASGVHMSSCRAVTYQNASLHFSIQHLGISLLQLTCSIKICRATPTWGADRPTPSYLCPRVAWKVQTPEATWSGQHALLLRHPELPCPWSFLPALLHIFVSAQDLLAGVQECYHVSFDSATADLNNVSPRFSGVSSTSSFVKCTLLQVFRCRSLQKDSYLDTANSWQPNMHLQFKQR